MKRVPVAAGNWKLNKTADEAQKFISEFLREIPSAPACEVIFAPVALSIPAAVGAAASSYIRIAAQNTYHKNSGAFTGELSPALIKSAGCRHSLVGHSERRTYFHETNKDLSLKNKALHAESMIPIYCIGETLQERESGLVEKILEEQLIYGLEGVEIGEDNTIIAYEPVWAIGTGRVASKTDAQDAHRFVRQVLERVYGGKIAAGIRILYGGSVSPENIGELIAQPDIDGGLVGGASLKPETFAPITRAIAAKPN